MKKLVCVLIASTILFANTIIAFANTDARIFTDKVSNTYSGTIDAKTLISNLKFTDVAQNYWAKDSILKAGALQLVKGSNQKYFPTKALSNQEALVFVLRLMGLEKDAQDRGVQLRNLAKSQGLADIWSIGYLSIARDNGLITNAEYNEAVAVQQPLSLSPTQETKFRGEDNASRERVANWIYMAIDYISPEFLNGGSQQNIYKFSDWEQIDASYINGVEKVLASNIMTGLDDGRFHPKDSMNRAQMAQVLSNLDSVYYNIMGISNTGGTINGIKDEQTNKTTSNGVTRNIYVRNDGGTVDVLSYGIDNSSTVQNNNTDAVVVKNGNVIGLDGLSIGDKVEYLTSQSGDILYVKVISSSVDKQTINAKLNKVDYDSGKIHIIDSSGKTFVYYLTDGLYGFDDKGNYLVMSNGSRTQRVYSGKVPVGSEVSLSLQNNIITGISYVGQEVLVNEIKGVVVNNSPEFGYITIVDSSGNEITKNYYENDLVVEKQQYYEVGDEIGYIDQVFPDFRYDPRDTTIDQIEPGDIVFLTIDDDDPNYIKAVSASTNYTMKYAKVNNITNSGNLSNLIVQYENYQTGIYEVPNNIYVSKEGNVTSVSNIQAGDWIKILVNEAVIAPGQVMESVKEIKIESAGHNIGDIIKGEIGAINYIQKTISIKNAYTLSKAGWTDHKEVLNLHIDDKNTEYYLNDKRVSPSYVSRFLKGANGQAYIALSDTFGGDTIAKVTFRTGRDEILDSDTVVNFDGGGGFSTYSKQGISTDEGTIVRRNGRLVNGGNIMVSDYARVIVNGGSNAAVVDIYDTPTQSSFVIARGRVLSVDEGKSFKVKSMSILNNDRWSFTPIEREFTIDHNTMFMTSEGVKNINTFMDYSKDTVANKVFTIISNGTSATHIIDGPYSKNIARGTVYSSSIIKDNLQDNLSQDLGDVTVNLKDSTYYDTNTGSYKAVSYSEGQQKSNDLNVKAKGNTVVIKNGSVTSTKSLEKGDKIKVFTAKDMTATGFNGEIESNLIIVEN